MDVFTVAVDWDQGLAGITVQTQPATRGIVEWTPMRITNADAIAKAILAEPLVRENGQERRYMSSKSPAVEWKPVR